MSEQTLQIIDVTVNRVRAAGRRILGARALTGLAVAIGCTATVWLVGTLAESILWMPTWARLTTAGVVAAVVLTSLTTLVIRPVLQLAGVLRPPSAVEVARRVEAVVPDARHRLVAFLQLAGGHHTNSPREIVEQALHSLYEPFRASPFQPVESFRSLRRALRLSAMPLLALTAFIVAAPGPFADASLRLLKPATVFMRPAPFTLAVTPGDVEVLRGDSLMIRIAVSERAQVMPFVEFRRPGERVKSVNAAPESHESRFSLVESNIRRTFHYRAVAGPVSSPWYHVEILDRPVVGQLQVTVASPSYSRLGRVRLDPNVGDVTALPGSFVDVEVATSGGATATADIVMDDGTRVPLSVDEHTAVGRFRLTREGSYHVELIGDTGITNENPIEYRLQLIADSPPSVVITSPDTVEELVEPFETEVSARIMDDFGFHRAALMYRLAESRFGQTTESFEEVPVELSSSDLEQIISRRWEVAGSAGSPVPGDVIEYFVRVWDNDAYSGYKSADSRVQRLVMPSLADQYRDMNEVTDDSANELEEMIESAEDVGKRFRELRKELQRKPESDWDDERRLEQIRSMQQELESNIEDVSSGLQDLARKMEENGLVSEETLEMFEQLQRTMAEINSPELMEALDKLRESMQNLDLQQMQESMNDFEFNEDQFRQRLERALELFKRLQAQQGLEEVARRAEELAKLQENLRDKTAELTDDKNKEQDASETGSEDEKEQDADPEDQGDTEESARQDQRDTEESDSEGRSDDPEQDTDGDRESAGDDTRAPEEQQETAEKLAVEQELSEAEMRELESRLEELQQLMNELPRDAGERLQELREQLEQQGLPKQMLENAEQLRKEQLQPAMEGQQQMQQQLSKLQQDLSEMQESMRGNQLQLNISGLRQVLNDILILSQQQEEMRTDVSETETDSPSLRKFAREQIELGEGLRVVSDTLQKLSREIPEMSREVQVETGLALREIQSATESLADRSARRAAGHQKASMMHLNELALLLSDLLNMLMNQQMGMGMPSMQQMLQQLQQMSGQQQQLNQQIQQMLNDLQGQRLSTDMQTRMRQLAEQQARIREQLKELSRNPELRGKALGDLDKIAEQMEETIGELEHSRVNRELIERQQQILTRLLDASRSINERGKEKRRESQTGEEEDRVGPSELTPEERANQLRRDLIRALESGYAPDYEELIRRYFNLLQESREPAPAE